jgi:hypothetical protein
MNGKVFILLFVREKCRIDAEQIPHRAEGQLPAFDYSSLVAIIKTA